MNSTGTHSPPGTTLPGHTPPDSKSPDSKSPDAKSADATGAAGGSSLGNLAPKKDEGEPTPLELPIVPRRWNRGPMWILASLAILWSLYMAKAIFFPIVLAIVLYFLLSPLTRGLCRLGIPVVVGAGIVVFGGTLLVALSLSFLLAPAANFVATAPQTMREAERKLWFVLEPIYSANRVSKEISNMADSNGEDGEGRPIEAVPVQQRPLSYVAVQMTTEILTGGLVTIILLYLLLALGHRTLNSIIAAVPSIRNKHAVVRMVRNVEGGVSQYVVTVATINACLGIVIGSVMGILGMPNAILIGVMAAALNFVPYLGCLVGCVITFLIAVVSLPTAWEAVLPPLLYLGINSVEGNLLTPMILGNRMSMNPVLVFLSLVFWGWLWGIGGVLIAVPVLGVTKIVCENFQSLRPIGDFISGVSRLEAGG